MIMENIHHAAAAVATVIALSLPAAPVLAGVLDADGISAQIIGKELVARRMGMKVHLRYDPDGSVTIRSPFFSGTGSWRRDGNRLCMTVAGAPGPETSCHGFEDLGGGKFRNTDGMVLREEG